MKRPAGSRRQKYVWILSLAVVASMICSVVVMIRPPTRAPQPTPMPIRVIATWTPTPSPSPSCTATLTPTRQP